MGLEQLPKQFRNVGLRMPVAHKEKRLILSVEAGPKVGKTRMMFDGPKPLLYVRFDPNSELQEEQVVETEDQVYLYEVPIVDVAGSKLSEKEQAIDKAQFSKIRQMIYDACETGFFRSCSIDTGDLLWVLAQRGFLGGTGFGTAPQSDFSVPNGAMTRIYNAVKAQRKMSLLVSHRLRDEREDYVNDKGKKASKLTGNLVAAGWKQTQYEAQTVVRLEYDEEWQCEREACQTKKGCLKPALHEVDRYKATITLSQYAGRGTVLRGHNVTFQNIGLAVFPTTQDNPEVWL